MTDVIENTCAPAPWDTDQSPVRYTVMEPFFKVISSY